MTLSHVTALKQTGRGAPCLLRLWLVCHLQTVPAEAKSKPLHSSIQQNPYFFFLWEPMPLCSRHVVLIQNQGQRSMVLIQNHGQWCCVQGKISVPPPVDRSNIQRKIELSEWWQKRELLQADNVRAGKLCRMLACLEKLFMWWLDNILWRMTDFVFWLQREQSARSRQQCLSIY